MYIIVIARHKGLCDGTHLSFAWNTSEPGDDHPASFFRKPDQLPVVCSCSLQLTVYSSVWGGTWKFTVKHALYFHMYRHPSFQVNRQTRDLFGSRCSKQVCCALLLVFSLGNSFKINWLSAAFALVWPFLGISFHRLPGALNLAHMSLRRPWPVNLCW